MVIVDSLNPDKPLLFILKGVASGELTPEQALPLVKQAAAQISASNVTGTTYSSISMWPGPVTAAGTSCLKGE